MKKNITIEVELDDKYACDEAVAMIKKAVKRLQEEMKPVNHQKFHLPWQLVPLSSHFADMVDSTNTAWGAFKPHQRKLAQKAPTFAQLLEDILIEGWLGDTRFRKVIRDVLREAGWIVE